MKRIIFSLLVLLVLALPLVGQELFAVPQTVAWDDPPEAQVSELSVVRVMHNRNLPGDHLIIGVTAAGELLIDLAMPTGVYIVSVRSQFDIDGYIEWGGYAFSDVPEDVDPVLGTFLLIMRPGGKPKLIRIKR